MSYSTRQIANHFFLGLPKYIRFVVHYLYFSPQSVSIAVALYLYQIKPFAFIRQHATVVETVFLHSIKSETALQ